MFVRGRFTNPLLRCRRRSAAAIPSGVAGGEISDPALMPMPPLPPLPLLALACASTCAWRPDGDAVVRPAKGRVATGAATPVESFGMCTPLRPLRAPVGLVVGPMSSTEVGDVGLNGSSVLSSWAPSSVAALLMWAVPAAPRPALGGGSAE